jgi:LysM repeat protein
MTDHTVEVLGSSHDGISEVTHSSLFAFMRGIWTRTEGVEVKDRLRDTVLLPFVERYRVKTLMIIATLLAVGALGYMVLQGEASDENDSAMPTATPTEVIVFDAAEGQTFDDQQRVADGTTEIYTELTQEQLHVVQAGENLFRISLRYGVSVDALVAANNIVDRNLIWVGQQLVIPAQELAVPPQPTLEARTAYPQTPTEVRVNMPGQMVTTHHYCVDQYDTLSGIAQKFGVTVDWLVAVNGIADPSYIKFGQFLIVVQ